MKTPRHLALCTILAAALAALAGCGGGGGSSGAGSAAIVIPTSVRSESASADSDVSAANYGGFATRMGRLVLSATGGAVLNGATGSGEPSLSIGREQPSAINTSTLNCSYGGTLLLTLNDADNNHQATAGDTLTLAATNCQLLSNGSVANGSLSLLFNAVELASNNLVAFDASGTYGQFQIDNTGSLTGNVRVWLRINNTTDAQERVSFNGAQSLLAGETVVYNVDGVSVQTGTTETFSLDGAIGVLGAAYKVVQVAPFTIVSGDVPTAGVLNCAMRLATRCA